MASIQDGKISPPTKYSRVPLSRAVVVQEGIKLRGVRYTAGRGVTQDGEHPPARDVVGHVLPRAVRYGLRFYYGAGGAASEQYGNVVDGQPLRTGYVESGDLRRKGGGEHSPYGSAEDSLRELLYMDPLPHLSTASMEGDRLPGECPPACHGN